MDQLNPIDLLTNSIFDLKEREIHFPGILDKVENFLLGKTTSPPEFTRMELCIIGMCVAFCGFTIHSIGSVPAEEMIKTSAPTFKEINEEPSNVVP